MNFLLKLGKRYSSSFTKLRERGLIQNVFPHENQEIMKVVLGQKSRTIYAGFDPTAESLHVGNLLIIIGLIHFQRQGHQPIALIGGTTGKVGDPSGRSKERVMLESNVVDENSSNIQNQIHRIFHNHQKYFSKSESKLKPPVFINNSDWYNAINFADFISTFGKYFRMGDLLSRSSVQTRLQSDSGMSFTEFTYQIFQAYDWLHLFKEFDCKFQMGGSDQMGNIMSGHELISRVVKGDCFGLTLPIITNEEGNKFGKSAGNAVWLDSEKTSEFSFYQFFIRIADSEVEKLLKLLTFLPLNEINDIVKNHQKTPEMRSAQKILAEHVTLLIHGSAGLEKAKNISKALYSGEIEALGSLDPKEISSIFVGAQYVELLKSESTTVLEAAMKAKCFLTEKDAMRIITSGGFSINQKKATNISEIISPSIHIMKNSISIFRVGKKNYFIVKWT